MFKNKMEKSYIESFVLENTSVINNIDKTLSRHFEILSSNFRVMFDSPRRKHSGNMHSNIRREECKQSKFSERELSLAVLGEDVENIIKSEIDELTSAARKIYAKSSEFECIAFESPRYAGIDIYGKVDRVGPEWKAKLKDEISEVMYTNDNINKEVFDLDKLIYVSYFFGKINGSNYYNSSTSDNRIIVELDALLIRYMSSLSNANELQNMLDTICLILNDKVARVMSAKKILYKTIVQYIPSMVSNCSGKVSPKDLYMLVTTYKLIADGVNGIINEDTVKKTLDLASLSLKNAGSIFNISSTASLIQGFLQSDSGRPKYLNRYLDIILGVTAEKKSSIVNALNISGKLSNDISSRQVNESLHERTALEPGTESMFIVDRSSISKIASALEEVENEVICMFSIYGMEDSNNDLDMYKKRSRGELLASLSNSARKKYLSLENEVMRYRSDCINCKDNSQKSTLLTRSKSISKIISLELSKHNVEYNLVLLLTMLEDNKYEYDNTLSNRNFNKERSSKMYGQFMPSKDWDY